MTRYLAFLAVAVVATISFLGFQGKVSKDTPVYVFDDMDYQNKYKAQGENKFFADGRADERHEEHADQPHEQPGDRAQRGADQRQPAGPGLARTQQAGDVVQHPRQQREHAAKRGPLHAKVAPGRGAGHAVVREHRDHAAAHHRHDEEHEVEPDHGQ